MNETAVYLQPLADALGDRVRLGARVTGVSRSEVIVLTGSRPDLSFLDELRLGLDERLQAPFGRSQ